MKSLLHKAGLPLIIILVAVLAAGAMIAGREPPEQLDVETRPFLVEAAAAHFEDLHFTVKSQGTVMPKIQTILSTQVNGRVVEVADAFIEGGMFKKGDLLVLLEQDDYITDLKAAEAEMARAEASLEEEQARGKVAEEEWRTVSSAVAPALGLRKPQLAQELANLRAAQANLERAKRNLERTQIRAPYDGLVKSKDVDLGQFMTVGQQLGMVYSTAVAEVRMPLSDHDLAYLELPQNGNGHAEVTFTATVAGKPTTWQGKLSRNEGVLDTQRRVIYAVAEIDDPYLRKPGAIGVPLKFGRFLQAEIEGNRETGLVVMPRSVLRLDGSLLVVGDDRKLQIRKVGVIRADEEYVYINSGLEDGDLVAVTTVPNPYEGMPVRLPDDLPAPEDKEDDTSVIAASGGK